MLIRDFGTEHTITKIREHSFFRRGGGVWAGRIQGRVSKFLPAQKGRVSINLTQQREGSLKFYCFPGEGHIF